MYLVEGYRKRSKQFLCNVSGIWWAIACGDEVFVWYALFRPFFMAVDVVKVS